MRKEQREEVRMREEQREEVRMREKQRRRTAGFNLVNQNWSSFKIGEGQMKHFCAKSLND